jgi:hypothetical protein
MPKRTPQHTYEVIVGNIGTVHTGPRRNTHDGAEQVYAEYSRLVSTPGIRASGETVTLFKDGEIVKQFTPMRERTLTIRYLADEHAERWFQEQFMDDFRTWLLTNGPATCVTSLTDSKLVPKD